MKQAHSRHLPGVQQIPIRAYPNYEEIFTFRGQGHVFGMSHRERFTIGQVQLKGAERRTIPHFFKVGDFHDLIATLADLPGFSMTIS